MTPEEEVRMLNYMDRMTRAFESIYSVLKYRLEGIDAGILRLSETMQDTATTSRPTPAHRDFAVRSVNEVLGPVMDKLNDVHVAVNTVVMNSTRQPYYDIHKKG